jgi:DNA replication initiation complex subunit (GINS family)
MIALLALRKVAGDNPSTDNLTPDELVLFSSLTSVLTAHKDSNADFEELGPRQPRKEHLVTMPEPPSAKACEERSEDGSPGNEGVPPLVMARVLEDVPTFVGVDREYSLRKEDVVSLPEGIAKTLLDHGKICLIGSA